MIHKFTKIFHFVCQFLTQEFSQIVYQLTLIKIILVEFPLLNLFAHNFLNFQL